MQTEQSYDRLVTTAAPALLRLAYLLTGNNPGRRGPPPGHPARHPALRRCDCGDGCAHGLPASRSPEHLPLRPPARDSPTSTRRPRHRTAGTAHRPGAPRRRLAAPRRTPAQTARHASFATTPVCRTTRSPRPSAHPSPPSAPMPPAPSRRCAPTWPASPGRRCEMTTPTDTDLEDLLRTTFETYAAHPDPQRAQALAATVADAPPRRRWTRVLLAAGVAGALVLGGRGDLVADAAGAIGGERGTDIGRNPWRISAAADIHPHRSGGPRPGRGGREPHQLGSRRRAAPGCRYRPAPRRGPAHRCDYRGR